MFDRIEHELRTSLIIYLFELFDAHKLKHKANTFYIKKNVGTKKSRSEPALFMLCVLFYLLLICLHLD